MSEIATMPAGDSPRLTRLPSFHALNSLLFLSLRQQFRGWRPIILSALFLLPGALALLSVVANPHRGTELRERLTGVFVYMLIPGALAPLAALLCAGGIVRDETEEQTLTYLLLRPVPRTLLYAIKLLAAIITAATITVFFALATLVFITLITGGTGSSILNIPVISVAAVFGLAQVAYCSLFGLLGMTMRRSLVVGVAYIILFEWSLGSFESLVRHATVMYYYRVLALRWLKLPHTERWRIDLMLAPTAVDCVLYLLVAGLVLTVLGSLILSTREFRMKTPEGQ